jgi:chemotaxis protein CheC
LYTSLELDALKEVGNIGAGNAATALSILLSKTIKINVPQAKLMPFDDVAKTVGGHEEVVAGLFMRFTGDIDGNILVIIDEGDLKTLLELLLRQTVEYSGNLSPLEVSALSELGNIVASSYLVALSNFSKLSMKLFVPAFALDMAGAILSFPLSLYGYLGDMAFLIETEFVEGLEGIKLHFFLIPDDESLKVILKAIGVNVVARDL